ncbi:MAG: hypothetical protein B5M52_03795 [Helicobacteraceae bacterium 4484_230]|nr:MAG: hypothetical protein B5M52_03795 [Helicobacteraceae bacterium 4484_230]
MKVFAFISGFLLSVQLFGVNINTASVEELSSLKGIGEKTAVKIVEYRKEHKFNRINEIKNVRGVGEERA